MSGHSVALGFAVSDGGRNDLGPDRDAASGSNMLRLLDRPNERYARTIAVASKAMSATRGHPDNQVAHCSPSDDPEERRKAMRRGCSKVYLLVGYFFLATIAATAQEVVHAFCGTIRSINSTTKTITVGTD